MKSVGESMGIGRTFAEAFAKARRGLEIDQEWRPENLHPWFARELEQAVPAGPPAFRRVDSCAGEVEAASNYFYSTRGERDERGEQSSRHASVLPPRARRPATATMSAIAPSASAMISSVELPPLPSEVTAFRVGAGASADSEPVQSTTAPSVYVCFTAKV